MKRLTLIIAIVFSGALIQAQELNENASKLIPVKYKITYISIDDDGSGYVPENKYLKITQSGNRYTIHYGGYSTFSLKFDEFKYDNYYYSSEEGLLLVSSKIKLSDISKGIPNEGWLSISFECCLNELIKYERMGISKK